VVGVGAGLYIKFKSILGGPTPKKYSGRAHPLEALLDLRARALRALEALLKKPPSGA